MLAVGYIDVFMEKLVEEYSVRFCAIIFRYSLTVYMTELTNQFAQCVCLLFHK